MIVTQTKSGILFRLLEPRTCDVRVSDVAHHLSLINRFGGATSVPYSVAEHSLRMCWAARALGYSHQVQLEALCHDAEEAYCGDVTKQWKDMLGAAYSDLTRPIKVAVGEALGVDLLNLCLEVHWLDTIALQLEAEQLMADATVFPVAHGAAECRPYFQNLGQMHWVAPAWEVEYHNIKNEIMA